MENNRNRPVRVAVASDDGETIRQHFGRVSQFLIYEIDGDAVRLVEHRENEPACDTGRRRHFDSYLAESVDLVSDCRAVLAAQIGPVAQSQLAARGVLSFQVTGLIGAVLSRLSKNIGRVFPQQQDNATPSAGKAL
jgi:predicted Fe-Mo cluster-binding NifX family protein